MCTFVSVLCIRCILYNIMTVEPSSVRKQNKQKNGNTPSHESRQHCAHDACYNTMHVTALCICVGWCFQRVSSTVVFSGRLQRVSSTDVFNRCLQRVFSTGVPCQVLALHGLDPNPWDYFPLISVNSRLFPIIPANSPLSPVNSPLIPANSR